MKIVSIPTDRVSDSIYLMFTMPEARKHLSLVLNHINSMRKVFHPHIENKKCNFLSCLRLAPY